MDTTNTSNSSCTPSEASTEKESANSFEPGICVKIQGLHRAPHLNGCYGTLLCYHEEGPSAGRWGVRLDDENKGIDVCSEHLTLAVSDDQPQAARYKLPPMIDKWDDLTNASALLDEETLKDCRHMAASAETIEQAEQDIYAYIHDAYKGYDQEHFDDLFLFGTGTFAQMNVRFEAYVSWLLRQHHTNALQHDGWIAFVTNRAAVIREVMKRPPLWQIINKNKDEILSPRQLLALHVLSKIDEKKAFCFRYILGDVEAAQVAELYLHDCLKRLHARKKMQRPFALFAEHHKPDP